MKAKKYLYLLLLSSSLLMSESYEKFIASMDKEYSEFQTEMDKDFTKFLNKEWKAYGTKTTPVYHRPKPLTIPTPPKQLEPVKDNTSKVKLLPLEIRNEIVPTLPLILGAKKGYQQIELNFFQQSLPFNYNAKLLHSVSKVNNHSIANYWRHQSSCEVQSLIQDIKSYQQALNLTDWHLYLLVKQLGQAIAVDENNAKLLSWFLLIKLGYDVKVGYKGNQVYLLVGLAQDVTSVPYSSIRSRRYFNFDKIKNVKTYAQSFGKNRLLNLDDNRVPYLKKEIRTRTLSFHDGLKAYQIPVTYNQNLIDLYNHYPRLTWKYYFAQNISPLTKKGLFKQLRFIMKNMTELEAVTFLLHLTQNSFSYLTDTQQFSEERSLFFEESLNYPANDCEDRSIFFAKLVRGLLGLKVVALYYPNHLATAVAFKSKVKGDYIEKEGEQYTVCDPTYINANVGMSMSKFKGMKPIRVIPIL